MKRNYLISTTCSITTKHFIAVILYYFVLCLERKSYISSSENFPICTESLRDGRVIHVNEKDADGIITAGILLSDCVVVTSGCNVHVKYRKRYVNKKEIQLKKRDFS